MIYLNYSILIPFLQMFNRGSYTAPFRERRKAPLPERSRVGSISCMIMLPEESSGSAAWQTMTNIGWELVPYTVIAPHQETATRNRAPNERLKTIKICKGIINDWLIDWIWIDF